MFALESRLAGYWPLISNFARRELKARYRFSVLGWSWSLINPLAIVGTYSLVFSTILRIPPPATANGRADHFALYLFTGLVVWTFFSACVNGSMDWLAGVSDLRKKVYFPAETAVIGGAMSAAVQSLLETAVLFAIMIGFLNVSWTFLLFPLVLVGVGSFGLGIGLVCAIYNQMYRDVRYLVGIVLQLMFFLVPIIYTLEIVPTEAHGLPLRTLIRFNPVTSYVTIAHDLVYHVRLPSWERTLAAVVYSTIPILLGIGFFRRRAMANSEQL